MHLQKEIQDWTQALIPGLPQVVKAVDNVQALAVAKAHNPECITVLRHWYDGKQVFGGTYEDNKHRAREFFDTFIDGTFRQYAHAVDYVEEWNEYLAASQTDEEVYRRVLWANAAADVWHSEYSAQDDYTHIKLVLCNTAVGNLMDERFAEIAYQFYAVLGYHPYTYWYHLKRPELDWKALSGLWDVMDHAYVTKPNWLFTEAGPFESAVTGWRSSACLGGDRALYVEAMRQWYRDVKGTTAYREGRLVGKGMPAIFTSGGGDQWRSFETTADELVPLYEMFQAEQVAAPEPPPPEEPPAERYVRVKSGATPHLNLRTADRRDIGDLIPGGGPLRVVGEDGDWTEVAGWAWTGFLEEA